ncbi:MAG: transcriptional regulator [bacterium]
MAKKPEREIVTSEIDKIIHEPVRLSIMSVLCSCEEADFNYLLNLLKLTKGNLSVHITKLEDAGYVKVTKKFVDKIPNTTYSVTNFGIKQYEKYLKDWKNMVSISHRKI